MKKTLYTLILLLAVKLCIAQTTVPYVSATWKPATIDSIKDNIAGLIGAGYKFDKKVIIDDPATAYLYFTNSTGKLTVTLNKGYAQVVNEVSLDGSLADLYPVYNKLFKATDTIDEVSKQGFISFNVKQAAKVYTVSLAKDGKSWSLNIKAI